MSRSGLARVWAILGGLLTVYAIGTWTIIQGGKSFAEIPGLEEKAPVTSAYQAVLIIGILLGLLSATGLFYLRTSREADETILPIVAMADVGPHDRRAASTRLYQGFFVVIFLLVPASSLYRLNSIILEHGVLWHEGDPAMGSIAVKNSFGWLGKPSKDDLSESVCTAHVLRGEGFVWLANTRCDIAKAEKLKPFDKTGRSIKEDAIRAPNSCARDLAMTRSDATCDNVRDMSEECEHSERHCRGMQWLPSLSPLFLAGATFFGWFMLSWLTAEAWCRRKPQ